MNQAQDEIAWAIKLDPPLWDNFGPLISSSVWWRVWMCFRFKNKQSDVDGPIKRTLDALQIGLRAVDILFDDRDVVDLRVQKSVVNDHPHIVIHLEAQ